MLAVLNFWRARITTKLAVGTVELDKRIQADQLLNEAGDELGQLAEAIADYDEAIEINPQDAAAYYNRGLAYKD